MNVVSRGVRNAFRSPIRSGSIVVILALSIGLIIAMLAARQAVADRISEVKSSVGTSISVSPAGVRGFEGGGEALTSESVAKVKAVDHITAVSSQLSDRLTANDTTTLESSVELGSLGQRRANESNTSNFGGEAPAMQAGPAGGSSSQQQFNPQASVTITGIEDTSSKTVWGGTSVTWTSGQAFDGLKDENTAVIGKALAEKNSLAIGGTFTAYGTEVKVVGIYDAGNTFANNGVFVSLSALQRLSDQAGSITSTTATVDSVDNLDTATTAVQTALGDTADVTNSKESIENSITPLESVQSIALFSLIGAVIAGAVIVLLTMIMIVRERRREIGVMKAIGASNIGVMGQFIIESLTLTAMALIVGLGIGVAASTPLTNALVKGSTTTASQQTNPGQSGGSGRMMTGGPRQFGQAAQQTVQAITTSVGIKTILYGIGATLLIAVIGSAIPAFLISKIKPADAMRSE